MAAKKKQSALEKARVQLKKAEHAHTPNTIRAKLKKDSNKKR